LRHYDRLLEQGVLLNQWGFNALIHKRQYGIWVVVLAGSMIHNFVILVSGGIIILPSIILPKFFNWVCRSLSCPHYVVQKVVLIVPY
jgi:hypothetical protein